MVERRGDLRLAEEPLTEALVLGELRHESFSATLRPSRTSSAR